MQIVETSSNQFFSVTAAGPGLDHVWEGVEVTRVKGEWVPKAKARPMLVRKADAHTVFTSASSFQDISHITEYGVTSRLQSAVRVF